MGRPHRFHRMNLIEKAAYVHRNSGSRMATCRCGTCGMMVLRRQLMAHKSERCPGWLVAGCTELPAMSAKG